jgi:hypothetical protein
MTHLLRVLAAEIKDTRMYPTRTGESAPTSEIGMIIDLTLRAFRHIKLQGGSASGCKGWLGSESWLGCH